MFREKEEVMTQNMAEHHAVVVVNAPVHQVYSLFCHFNDFPKFMRFVKEVTYYDDQRSHWVADVAGSHEWDAVNEAWIPDQQIGWRSFNGLQNYGRVNFRPIAQSQTMVDVTIDYDPPAGILGDMGERMGIGRHFEEALQEDLNNFARMVDLSPVNAQDPNWSRYLFHPESAAARGTTTPQQNETMGDVSAAAEYYQGYAANPDQSNAGGMARGSEFVPPDATQGYTSSPGLSRQDYAPPSGTGRDAQATPATPGTPTERPILDQDIINEPSRTSVEDEGKLPPEQIPPRSYPEGNQPQP